MPKLVNGEWVGTEAEEQMMVFRWAAYQVNKYPELEYMHHIPNGGKRNPREAKKLKEQGVKPGVPDIELPAPRGGYHGLYIEMKTAGGRASKEQKKFIEYLNGQGYKAIVCFSSKQAIYEIEKYLSQK